MDDGAYDFQVSQFLCTHIDVKKNTGLKKSRKIKAFRLASSSPVYLSLRSFPSPAEPGVSPASKGTNKSLTSLGSEALLLF